MIPEIAPSFMPQMTVPLNLCEAIELYKVNDKLQGNFTFEVIGKDESGIEIKVKSINLAQPKRVI